MAKDVRTRMIEGAVRLLASRGLDATSFPEVLALTGASRGSVYHHFPGGKDELVRAAIDVAGRYLLDALDALDGQPADAVVARFLDVWRHVLVASRFESGCAVAAVTVAADSPTYLGQVAAIFRGWQTRLAALLVNGGLSKAAADRLATWVIASTEGAVLLARADQSVEPFDAVAGELRGHVRRLLATPR
jgi:TetR/AcrR family transcriptional repressor of lmrAB and yxaGH operons